MAARSILVVLGLMLMLAASIGSRSALALGDEPRAGETITQYMTPAILPLVFPGADKIGEVGGTPPTAAVYRDGRQVGYVFSTWDVTQSKGFSNRPLILLVGIVVLAGSGRNDATRLPTWTTRPLQHLSNVHAAGLRCTAHSLLPSGSRR